MIERDNAIPRSLLNKVKTFVESDTFPWFYQSKTAYATDDSSLETLYNGSFSHIAIADGRKNSEIAHTLEDSLMYVLDSMGKTVSRLHRARIGLLPISPVTSINPPHVDVPFNHTVGLLYLNDSDGDTIIYNERYNPYMTHDVQSYYQQELNGQVTEMHRSTPKENKILIFDGMHYHSSSTPTLTKRRIAVNFVFEAEDLI